MMIKLLCKLLLLTMLLCPTPAVSGTVDLITESNVPTNLKLSALSAPGFVPLFDQQVHQNNINLVINNSNDGSSTEIYRSTSADGPYQLIHTEGPGPREFRYVDENLKPRTTFYYKARAILDSLTSPYSETVNYYAQSGFYPPYLNADVQSDRSVEIAFQDLSYHDNNYTIYRTNEDGSNEIMLAQELILSDSGQTRSFTDAPDPGGTYIYHVNAEVRDEGFPTYYSVSTNTVYVAGYLIPPNFDFENSSGYEPCGNQIAFSFENPNEGSNTEIWRSRSADSRFELIAVAPGSAGYLDEDLESNKSYYYKLRAITEADSSEFSETVSLASGAKWFDPHLELTLLPDNTVQGKLTDRSFLDAAYEVHWGTSPTGFFTSTHMTDSGRVFTFIDASVQPGQAYTYEVDAVLVMTCGSNILYGVAAGTISIPESGPAVYGFTLIDPYTDQDVRALQDFDEFDDAASRYNIRANVNNKTESMQFFLNGKKFKDHKAPYSLFGDKQGNYQEGKLKPGKYTLTATAYSGNKKKGSEGNTLTIHFTVKENEQDAPGEEQMAAKVNVNVFPNPGVVIATVEILAEPNSAAQVILIDQQGNTFHTSEGTLTGDGVLTKEFNVERLKPGFYFIVVKLKNKIFTKRIVID